MMRPINADAALDSLAPPAHPAWRLTEGERSAVLAYPEIHVFMLVGGERVCKRCNGHVRRVADRPCPGRMED